MAHEIAWDNEEKTVVLQRYIQPTDENDMVLLAQKSAQLLKTVPHVVHLIIDGYNFRMKLNQSAIQDIVEPLVPPNQGDVIMTAPQSQLPIISLANQLTKIIAPKASTRVDFVSSIEEARTMLQERYGVVFP